MLGTQKTNKPALINFFQIFEKSNFLKISSIPIMRESSNKFEQFSKEY